MAENTDKVLKFIWKIENYSYCWNKKGDFLQSPGYFEMEAFEGSSWCLKLYPNGTASYSNYVSIYLVRLESCKGPFGIKVDYEIALLRPDGTAEYVKKENDLSIRKGHSLGFGNLASQEEILKKRSILLPEDILTVQCRIFLKEAQLKSYTEIIAKTYLELESFVFRWKSEHHFLHRYIEFYTLRLLNGTKDMSFKIWQTCVNQVENTCLTFETSANIKSFRFKVCILDCNDSISRCLLDERYSDIREKTVNLITVDEILKQKSLYLRNNKLTLHCDLTFFFGVYHSQIELVACDNIFPIVPANKVASYKIDMLQKENLCSCIDNDTSFKNDFQNLYQEGTLCDFTLKVGSENIQVHKAVLGARSPVFKAMLTSNMKENVKNMVDISDLDANTVRRMLTFMYTDAIGDLDFETASKLYIAGDKYQVMKLKRFCSNFLKQHLCVANVGKVLMLADLHADDYLEQISLQFLSDKETEIMCSTEWKTFMTEEPQFAAEIMHRIILGKAGIQ